MIEQLFFELIRVALGTQETLSRPPSKVEWTELYAMSKKQSLFKRLKSASSILIPLVLLSMDRIEVISNAMELRGFGKNKKRTWYMARPFKKMDYFAMAFCGFLLVLAIVLNIVNGSRFWNPII